MIFPKMDCDVKTKIPYSKPGILIFYFYGWISFFVNTFQTESKCNLRLDSFVLFE